MNITVLSVIIVLVGLLAGTASAQQTGSRIEGASNQPVEILRLDVPKELAGIRRALARNDRERAMRLARSLLDSDPSPDIQYAGHNALCSIHAHANDWDAALEACGRALRIRPGHWLALNSRGTAHLLQGDPDRALSDFRAALAKLPPGSRQAEVVTHNIALAEARRSPNG